MTQQELEQRNIQLYNDYSANAEPIKKEMAGLDTESRDKRHAIRELYDEINAIRDKRANMENLLRALKADYLNALQAARQELNVSKPQESANPWHPASEAPDDGTLILCLGPDGTKPWVERGDDYGIILPLKSVTRWRYLDDIMPSL